MVRLALLRQSEELASPRAKQSHLTRLNPQAPTCNDDLGFAFDQHHQLIVSLHSRTTGSPGLVDNIAKQNP
jgi:hypothetical protein